MPTAPAIAPTEEKLQSTGGINIFFRSWSPAGKPRAVVVLCHGFNAHGGLYTWSAEQLAAKGFAVHALDLRGRGKSDGRRFYVDDIADYVSDVAVAVKTAKSRQPGLPVFLLGHSAGGVVVCSYALDNHAELAGLISESFALRVPAPSFVLTIMKGLSYVAPKLPVLKLNNSDFSRDPKAVEAMNRDPLIDNEKQPIKTVAALVRAGERLEQGLASIRLPVLILHGTLDKATLPAGSQLFYDKASSRDKTLKLYEGHFHDLLADVGKEGVMADIAGWIEKRLPAA